MLYAVKVIIKWHQQLGGINIYLKLNKEESILGNEDIALNVSYG
jgi:hypothetical protein